MSESCDWKPILPKWHVILIKLCIKCYVNPPNQVSNHFTSVLLVSFKCHTPIINRGLHIHVISSPFMTSLHWKIKKRHCNPVLPVPWRILLLPLQTVQQWYMFHHLQCYQLKGNPTFWTPYPETEQLHVHTNPQAGGQHCCNHINFCMQWKF